jgi:hypothetical protein
VVDLDDGTIGALLGRRLHQYAERAEGATHLGAVTDEQTQLRAYGRLLAADA